MVPNMKARQFNTIIMQMTKEAQEVEAPKHSGRRGILLQEVLYIINSKNVAESWEQCLSGLPLHDNKGGTYMYSHSLVKNIKRRLRLNGLQPQELYESLVHEGVTVEEAKRGGKLFWYLTNLERFEKIEEEEQL